MTPRDLADALQGKREGHEWRCRCPVHGGRSLSVTEEAGRLLLVCRGGCPQGEVIAELKRLGLWGGNTRQYVWGDKEKACPNLHSVG